VALRPYAAAVIVFYGLAARHRWWFLLGVVLVTAALGTAVQATETVWVGIITFLGALLLSVVLLAGHLNLRKILRIEAGPAGFEINEVHHTPLLMAGALTVLWGAVTFAQRIGDLVRGDRSWLGEVWSWLPTLLILVFLVFFWFVALSGSGVRLDRAGVRIRRPTGSTFVPWESLTEGSVTVAPARRSWTSPSAVRLRTAEPGGDVDVASGDPGYLAWILRRYVDDPAGRASIGSEAELARILR
jgi:ABC-type amino acid transport system permease subunit